MVTSLEPQIPLVVGNRAFATSLALHMRQVVGNRASVLFLRKDIPRVLAWDNPFPWAAPRVETIPRKDYIQNTSPSPFYMS
jgi:hypothetical protein